MSIALSEEAIEATVDVQRTSTICFGRDIGAVVALTVGPGNTTMAVGAAMIAAPFSWLPVDRFLRKRP